MSIRIVCLYMCMCVCVSVCVVADVCTMESHDSAHYIVKWKIGARRDERGKEKEKPQRCVFYS